VTGVFGPARAEPPPGAALETKGLSKAYDDLVALEGLDLVVARGERVLVAGPNGSGKTTLLRTAAGLAEPTSGEVLVLGAPAGSLEARSVTSFAGEIPVLYDDLSVAEHLEYVARLCGTPDWPTRAHALAGRLGLEARLDELPARMSLGLRRRAALAVALVRPFALLLLDEPFAGLDEAGRRAAIGLVEEAAAAGAAVVVATHAEEFVAHADRCVGLRDGRLVYDGPATPEALRRLVA
jgi:ABC-type multidrug transport system ATPase subunit